MTAGSSFARTPRNGIFRLARRSLTFRVRRAITSGFLALICSLTVQAPNSFALPDDKDQPIHISADKALRDERKGVTVYSGNVQMRQGTMEVDADKISFYHAAENANQVIAVGTPAKMRLQPEIGRASCRERV